MKSNLAGARDESIYQGIKSLGMPEFDGFIALAKSGALEKYEVMRDGQCVGIFTAERTERGLCANFKYEAKP